ncbi:MAG TPA: metal-dependent hydrolase [Planctomycetes bacterium]|nr:metal-dependent hydrolase [Planctomycetota bacterium]
MTTAMSLALSISLLGAAGAPPKSPPKKTFESDVLKTAKGDITLTFIGHGTLMLKFNDKVVHIDPVGQYADYAKLPKADLILVTHEHGDHLDARAIEQISTDKTEIVLTAACQAQLKKGTVMKNGDKSTAAGFAIEAVPAYNVKHTRPGGAPFHPKGAGNGYVIACGETRIYVAGDTENIPEMAALKDIHVAFLPMNLPYTMTPEMVAEAAKTFTPKILYPYHYGKTDAKVLADLLKAEKDIEVRIRQMQ